MKLILEELKTQNIEGVDTKVFTKVKEISFLSEAPKGSIIHKCRHDEIPQGACERVKI